MKSGIDATRCRFSFAESQPLCAHASNGEHTMILLSFICVYIALAIAIDDLEQTATRRRNAGFRRRGNAEQQTRQRT